jgi:hypothetical protein
MSSDGFEGAQRIERQFGMLGHLVYFDAMPADPTLRRQNIWDRLTEQVPAYIPLLLS